LIPGSDGQSYFTSHGGNNSLQQKKKNIVLAGFLSAFRRFPGGNSQEWHKADSCSLPTLDQT